MTHRGGLCLPGETISNIEKIRQGAKSNRTKKIGRKWTAIPKIQSTDELEERKELCRQVEPNLLPLAKGEKKCEGCEK